jgi:hypothetical protein
MYVLPKEVIICFACNVAQSGLKEFQNGSQACMGVPARAGVFAPGVAESVPAFFFFFFLREIRAGGLVTALRSER